MLAIQIHNGINRHQNHICSTKKLDGLTILRFAHAFSSGGGVEQYLADLDSTLLSRNESTIIQMHLSDDFDQEKTQIEKIGLGTLVKVPLDVGSSAREIYSDLQTTEKPRALALKNFLRDWILYNPLLYQILFRKIIKRRTTISRGIVALNAHEEAQKAFQDYHIDLVVMHFIGGTDSAAVVDEALKRNVPYIFINHFSNDRFNHMSVREQVADARGIAGVSRIGLPRRLRKCFVNLSDGIDTEIFKPEVARALNVDLDASVVILPARIVPTKGQKDLIEASAILSNQGLRFKVVLAGRPDSSQYMEQLKNRIRQLGMKNDVLFVGQLNREELRDWYGVSSIMAFPTYHHEGLGRILIEAQAMKVPSVAYIVGGTPEGVVHKKTGFLVPKGDIQGLAGRLRELLTDEKKRRRMGEEGRSFVERNFSLTALASRHEEFYLRVLRDVGRTR